MAPLSAPVTGICFLLFCGTVNFVIYAIRDTKRLAALALGPVLANLSEFKNGRKLCRMMTVPSGAIRDSNSNV